ncbi:MAG TPA: FAD-dependent oxidoreductase [Candidatus Saccharimonadales bacterium]|nr:FAD-dependent oxidoreductase [Candidatus Saccharimonadales bacterium]
MKGRNFAILGSGVIGLTTGVLLLEKFPKADVTIYASDFTNLVSHVAGAQFYPIWLGDGIDHSFEKTLKKWFLYSHKRFSEISNPAHDITKIQNYELARSGFVPSYFFDVLPNLKITKRANLPLGYTHMLSFETIMINPLAYLPRLGKKFVAMGGKLRQKTFVNKRQILNLPQSTVFNCLGCGASIFSDESLMPVKGVILRLKPTQGLNHVLSFDDHIIAPRKNETYIGASYIKDNFDLTITSAEKEYVFNGIAQALEHAGHPFSLTTGTLKKQNIIGAMSGFRPIRSGGPRVECEQIDDKKIIHNYGHGGNGVILSWGSSQQAIELADAK